MRVSLPFFLLRGLGRVRPLRQGASALSSDPANMGTEFGLEASIVGWSDSFLGRRDDVGPASTANDEPPLKWLGRPRARRDG